MKAWRHYLFNYLLLFTILNKCSIYSLKFESAQEGNRNSGGYCFRRFEEFPRAGTSVVKFSVKLLPANMGFINYSGLEFSRDFQNTQKQSL